MRTPAQIEAIANADAYLNNVPDLPNYSEVMAARVVEVEARNVYGNRMIYPANETARIFAELAGKKTLAQSDLILIRNLGFEIRQVAEALEEAAALPISWAYRPAA
jgi:hypothetical protein